MFRSATAGDYEAIEQLSQAIWKDDDKLTNRPPGWNRRRWTVGNHMRSDRTPGPTTLVGEVDGRIVAAGSVVFYEDQPRNHLYLHVAPGYRDRGIGKALFEALEGAHGAGPYMTREFGDPELVAMFESLGFRAMERHTEGWIHPSEPATAVWIDRVLAAPGGGFEIVALGDEGSATPLELARLFARFRERVMAWVPLPARSDAEELELFFGDAFSPALPGTTFCAFKGGRLVGGASLNKAAFGVDDSGSAHLAWVMVDPPDLAGADDVVEVLVAHVLDAARRKGLRVQVEASSANAHFKACVDFIPGTDLEEGLAVMISDPLGTGTTAQG